MSTKDLFGESDDLIKEGVVGAKALSSARLSKRDFFSSFFGGDAGWGWELLKNY